jgi:hypothetical protein
MIDLHFKNTTQKTPVQYIISDIYCHYLEIWLTFFR